MRDAAASLKFRCVVTILVASFAELLASTRCAGEPPGAPIPGDYLDNDELQQLISATMRYSGCPSPVAGNFALWVGILGTLVSLVYLVLDLSCPTALDKAQMITERVPLTVEGGLALFLVVWWAVGGGIATFIGPHNLAGNGYFACLVAIASSLRLVNAAFYDAPAEFLRSRSGNHDGASTRSKKYGTYLFACALTLLISAMQVCTHAQGGGGGDQMPRGHLVVVLCAGNGRINRVHSLPVQRAPVSTFRLRE